MATATRTTPPPAFGVWEFQAPNLGPFYVRAKNGSQAWQTATNLSRAGSEGGEGTAVEMGKATYETSVPGYQIYDARDNGTPLFMGKYDRDIHKDWFSNTGAWVYDPSAVTGGRAAPPFQAGNLGDGNQNAGYQNISSGDLNIADDDISTIDAVAGFLKGIGFDFTAGDSASQRFQQAQGALGAGVFKSQNVLDYFRDNDPATFGPQSAYQFGRSLPNQAADIGFAGLRNLEALSGLGNTLTGPRNVEAGSEGYAQFVNPYASGDVAQRDISAMLSAAFQGAGISPLLNRGVSRGAIADLFTRYAGTQQNLGSGGLEDQNFLRYAAEQLGLSRFFNQGGNAPANTVGPTLNYGTNA